MATTFTTPVGRLVQGDCFEPRTKDKQGNPRVVRSGPNVGQPAPQWFVGVAFAKNSPEWPVFKKIIDDEAYVAWPSLFPGGPGSPCLLPTFSNKIVDGDALDSEGVPWSSREGFAGHWVVRFTSGFAPKCYPAGRYSPADQITERDTIRRGHYVRIFGNVASNDNKEKKGLYLNMSLIEHAGYGPEIISGPDASAAFGAAPVALPPGASAIPVASGPLPGANPVAPPVAPPMPAAPPVAPPAPPAYTGYMTPRVMLPAANGATYEALIAAGWTDALLVQHGMMQA